MNADHMTLTLFESEFLIIWRMSFLEKWQLANKFFVVKSIVMVIHFCPQKKSWSFHFFKKESTMHLLKTLFLQTKYS